MKAWWAVLRRIEVMTGYALVFAIVLVPYDIHAKDQVSLSVTVIGLRSEYGYVLIALYDEPKNFPHPDGMITKAEAPIVAGVARYDFFVIEKKSYAIVVYHDENDNEYFDQGLLSIPLEDYAFSNDARVFLGPPSFDDAAFILSAPMHVNIRVN